DRDKWADLIENLRTDLGDPEARFRLVYLIDDFTGTGTTFLRYDQKKQKWKGKLIKFRESIESAVAALGGDQVLAPDWELCIHHYIASAGAAEAIERRHQEALPALNGDGWAKQVHASFGTILPADLPIDVDSRHAAFIKLTQAYYDPKIQTTHTDIGGVSHLGLGYGGCAHPLVLEHNTPNNAVALLWAETGGGDHEGTSAPAMRTLFLRRQRHA
ncbi:hypothetical protein WDZ92_52485, partial [Nostoc sp. NIES-2111]